MDPSTRTRVLLGALTGLAFAQIGHAGVLLEVPQDYPTIQVAIEFANDGDLVLVAPGTYNELIDYLGKDLAVQSTDGPEVTTIDAQGLGTAVTFDDGETDEAVLDGFTVTGGSAADGGGILCTNASGPTLIDLIVSGNTATRRGGGLHVDKFLWGQAAPITITVIDCAFVGNTSTGTDTESGGGAIAFFGFGGNGPSTLDVRGSTGSDLSTSSAAISDSNVGGSGGSGNWNPAYGTDYGGNIDVDPLFVNTAGGDFSLGAGSPCIDAADNGAVPADEFDLDGDGDMDDPLPLDVNGLSRFVDDPDIVDTGFGDVLALLSAWGDCAGCAADLNGDGAVGFGDLLVLLSAWGPCA